MLCRAFWHVAICLASLIFSTLTIIAGCRPGVLNNVNIASVIYEIDYAATQYYMTAKPVPTQVPGLLKVANEDDLHEWVFTVNYLSLCGGDLYGTEDEEYGTLACESKSPGWTFRSDDPYIINWLDYDKKVPVVPNDGPVVVIHTREPFATLLAGFIFSVLATTTCLWTAMSTSRRIAILCTSLLAIASILLIASSALLTKLIHSYRTDYSHYRTAQDHMMGLSWSAAGFMVCAFVYGAAFNFRGKVRGHS